MRTLFKIFTISFLLTGLVNGAASETVNNLCQSNSCLLGAVGNYKFCSLAPHNFQGKSLFQSQSFLSISGGGEKIVLETANGFYSLEPEKDVELKQYPEDEFSLAKEIRQTKLMSSQGFSAKYVFQGPIQTDPKEQHMQLSDMKLFFDHGYALQLDISHGSEVFPGMKDDIINYTPCSSIVQGTDEFHFTFKDESELRLTARVADGATEHGYYVGLLLSAIGEYKGLNVNVNNAHNLAMLGSTRSWSEVSIPTMVVSWAKHKENCGIIFDKTEWYAEDAVNGYHAYARNCDGGRGDKLVLTSANYSRRYQLP